MYCAEPDKEYPIGWATIRDLIKERDRYCRFASALRIDMLATCKAHKNLHVHHIDGIPANNSPDNLITLCASCHRKAHARDFDKQGMLREYAFTETLYMPEDWRRLGQSLFWAEQGGGGW